MNLLTDEEIKQILNDTDYDAENPFVLSHRAVAKAQTVKLIKWLDEPCTERLYGIKIIHKHHKDCPDCWNKLKQEVGL